MYVDKNGTVKDLLLEACKEVCIRTCTHTAASVWLYTRVCLFVTCRFRSVKKVQDN